jgi:hypothetical protein
MSEHEDFAIYDKVNSITTAYVSEGAIVFRAASKSIGKRTII